MYVLLENRYKGVLIILKSFEYNGHRSWGYLCLKILVSGILALIILTLLCKIYDDPPQHHINLDGVTDRIFAPYRRYFCFQEGFSVGKTNNEGYNNTFDFEKGMSLDVLLMGSSHMEAFGVMQDENTANLLGEFANERVYNIGVSGHFFPTCASNLKAALRKYAPSKFVIIEIMNLSFTDETFASIINHTFPHIDGAVGTRNPLREFMRENPYIYRAYLNIFHFLPNKFPTQDYSSFSQNNPELLAKVLAQMSDTLSQSKSGAKLIIAYHPPVSLNLDGSLKIESDPQVSRQFSELCEQNGIYFLDMSERFLSEYAKDYTLPYGFINTSVASGHLNRYGHRMFAEEIYKLMQRIEAQS